MIQIETAANIADIVGGATILVSLIYVGYQIRQTNIFAKAENLRKLQDTSFIDTFDYGVIARAWMDFNSLDLVDRAHFHKYMIRLLNHYRLIHDTWKLGLTDKRLVLDWQLALAQILATKGGSQWWARGGNYTITGEAALALVRYMDDHIQQVTPYDQLVDCLHVDAEVL